MRPAPRYTRTSRILVSDAGTMHVQAPEYRFKMIEISKKQHFVIHAMSGLGGIFFALCHTKPILPRLYDYTTQASILRLLKKNLIITRGYTRS